MSSYKYQACRGQDAAFWQMRVGRTVKILKNIVCANGYFIKGARGVVVNTAPTSCHVVLKNYAIRIGNHYIPVSRLATTDVEMVQEHARDPLRILSPNPHPTTRKKINHLVKPKPAIRTTHKLSNRLGNPYRNYDHRKHTDYNNAFKSHTNIGNSVGFSPIHGTANNYSCNNKHTSQNSSNNSSQNSSISNCNSMNKHNCNFNVSLPKKTHTVYWTDYMVEMLIMQLSESQYWTSMKFEILENDISKRMKDKCGVTVTGRQIYNKLSIFYNFVFIKVTK